LPAGEEEVETRKKKGRQRTNKEQAIAQHKSDALQTKTAPEKLVVSNSRIGRPMKVTVTNLKSD
jgi:hypothetical protein